ncbi:hypothetical protein D3C71_1196490 [compost metagenome]
MLVHPLQVGSNLQDWFLNMHVLACDHNVKLCHRSGLLEQHLFAYLREVATAINLKPVDSHYRANNCLNLDVQTQVALIQFACIDLLTICLKHLVQLWHCNHHLTHRFSQA